MDQSAQLVDKAVSTEDLRYATRDVNLDAARLEAVLNALVENKVESMKNEKTKSTSSQSTPMAWDKRLRRITSSSTASSSHKENNHGYDHRHKSRHYHKKRVRGRHEYERVRKSGHSRSNGRSHRVSSNSPESQRSAMHSPTGAPCCEHALSDDEEPYDFMQCPQELAERAYFVTCENDMATQCSCEDNLNGQLKMQYDDDYVSINIDDYENVEEDAIISHDALRRARRKRRRRRRKRKKKHPPIVIPKVEKVKVVDPDDLPQRARWTIVATACLLLLMCLLLVGVTLRMAPIIDDMVRKENEELLNSLSRETSYNASSVQTSPP